MTIILSCLTPKYIVQLSDRRLTFPDGRIHDDQANKAIVFHDRACFTYTGIAEINSQRTDEWIADQLVTRTGLQDAINHLTEALNGTIHRLRAPNRYLTIVVDLWGSQDAGQPYEPHSIAISNQFDAVAKRYAARPLNKFQQFNQKLPAGVGYGFLQQGQWLDGETDREMKRNVVRVMRHYGGAPITVLHTTVGRIMQYAIRRLARSNRTVGSDLMMAVLFNRQLPEYDQTPTMTCYLPTGSAEPIVYAPTIITETLAVQGFKFYPGPPR